MSDMVFCLQVNAYTVAMCVIYTNDGRQHLWQFVGVVLRLAKGKNITMTANSMGLNTTLRSTSISCVPQRVWEFELSSIGRGNNLRK